MPRLAVAVFLLLQPTTLPTTAPSPIDFVPIATAQRPDGSWDNSPRATALTSLAFLSAGHPPAVGRYGRVLTRATAYLRDPAHAPDARALLALANLAALDRLPETRAAAERIAGKLPAPTNLEDAAWHALALSAAERAGLAIPPDALLRLDAYLVSTRSRPGTFSLVPGQPPTPAANAAALILMLTLNHADSPETAILAARLPANLPSSPTPDPESAILLALARHLAALPPPTLPPSTPRPHTLLIQSLPSSPIPVFQR